MLHNTFIYPPGGILLVYIGLYAPGLSVTSAREVQDQVKGQGSENYVHTVGTAASTFDKTSLGVEPTS